MTKDEAAMAYITEKHLQEDAEDRMPEKPVKTVTVGVKVDDTEIKAAIAKAERLIELLTEAKRLIGELASAQVDAALEVKDKENALTGAR